MRQLQMGEVTVSAREDAFGHVWIAPLGTPVEQIWAWLPLAEAPSQMVDAAIQYLDE